MAANAESLSEFLAWFRERSEAAWMYYRSRSFEDYVSAHVGGIDWQRGTRWLGGLSSTEIDSIEQKWHVRFPPDYRLFLATLHATDRPMKGATFADFDDTKGHSSRLTPVERPGFYNWLRDDSALEQQWDWLVEGLQFDVEQGDLWLPSWGTRPASIEAQKEKVRYLVADAPRLIPVFSHRYVLAEPHEGGNPVFSIQQSDIIVYGPDLKTYLLVELGGILGIDVGEARRTAAAIAASRGDMYRSIPFWGEIWASA